MTASTALYLCSVTLISLMPRECRVATEVAVANVPKACSTAAEGVLSPSCRTYTPNWLPLVDALRTSLLGHTSDLYEIQDQVVRHPFRHADQSRNVTDRPASKPPSMTNCAPVTKLARSEARNAMSSATSSGFATRPKGCMRPHSAT
jgi:hypothetical protein